MAAPRRSQYNKTERVEGYDCEFVEPPPEHLIQSECPVCLLIIRNPQQVTCCGNKFCQSCIQCIKADSKPCPTCKAKEINTFPDIGLRRSLCSLKVHCSHQKDGCEWTGELGQLDMHLNTDPQPEKQLNGCQFVEIDCIYDCGDQLQRRYVQTHQTEQCNKRPYRCEYCHNYESNFDDVIHNHWPVCGSFPLRCPNECGSFPQRQNVDSHVADECPLTTISCDFLHVGCAVKLPRKDMPEHLRENFLTHISLLSTSHAKQQAQIASLVAVNGELKRRNVALEQLCKTKFAALQAEVTSLKSADKPKLKTGTSAERGHPVLRMPNVQQYMRNGDHWFSPPVYTHHQGYKICFRVTGNGYRASREATYIYVALIFMQGEFDDSLEWPFRGVISLQLLNQFYGEDHKTRSFAYDSTTDPRYCSRVTEGERSVRGLGHLKFATYGELKGKFLRDDTLLFQVCKVLVEPQ